MRPVPPPPELVAVRAYELFLQEGAVHGRDVSHWLRAEAELREARPAPRLVKGRATRPKG
jgi:hypothetical protein